MDGFTATELEVHKQNSGLNTWVSFQAMAGLTFHARI